MHSGQLCAYKWGCLIIPRKLFDIGQDLNRVLKPPELCFLYECVSFSAVQLTFVEELQGPIYTRVSAAFRRTQTAPSIHQRLISLAAAWYLLKLCTCDGCVGCTTANIYTQSLDTLLSASALARWLALPANWVEHPYRLLSYPPKSWADLLLK